MSDATIQVHVGPVAIDADSYTTDDGPAVELYLGDGLTLELDRDQATAIVAALVREANAR
ncbi:hypothetical protein MF406_14365 [Georgenia sp. TF02-10]|uniref:hypothetical protein n=1 Tax=Georgenia sp. TF02-10 TaxID=2917725 RepID=UPI001FA77FA4|nr:hypothetical protein [Georgenia sp. TF02-10]UNX54116.1 hypothetical protein MF406_14365 [Georgenia sp. TF02-10]